MELCVFVEVDLTACLNFSCLYMFHSISLHYYEITFGSVFCISIRPEDSFEILLYKRQWSLSVFGWL